MKFRWSVLIFVLALFASASAWGQSADSCELVGGFWYKYRIHQSAFGGDTGYTIASHAAMCAQAESHFCGNNPTHAYCRADLGRVPWTISGSATCRTGTGGDISGLTTSREVQSDPATQCPANPPDDPLYCDVENSFAGTTATASDWRVVAAAPRDFCTPWNGCVVEVRQGVEADGSSAWTMLRTDRDCASLGEGPEEFEDEEDLNEGESCIPVGDGEYCASRTGSGQCGYLNDAFICLNSVPDRGCSKVGDGALVCSPNAASPPAPDDGVSAGIPATPDDVITNAVPSSNTNTTTNNTYNYYSGTTVSGSSRDTDTSPGQQHQLPAGEDEESQDGVAGGEECDTPPVCTGNPVDCALLQQQFYTRCEASYVPTDSELEAMFGPSGLNEEGTFDIPVDEVELLDEFDRSPLITGACFDDWDMNLLGTTITIPSASMCTLMEYVGYLVILGSLLAGVRIVMAPRA